MNISRNFDGTVFQTRSKSCPQSKSSDNLRFNNIPLVKCGKSTGFPSTNKYANISNPIVYQSNRDDIQVKHNLELGPTRINHTVENLWNNQTRRKIL